MNTLGKIATGLVILSTGNACATMNNGAEPKRPIMQEARGEDCEELMREMKKQVGDVNDLLISADYLRGREKYGEEVRELEERKTTLKREFQKLEELENKMTTSCMKKSLATEGDVARIDQLQSATQRLRLRVQRLKTGQPIEF
jgi:vacuolar-type H+-ATPase subunit I/STV1